MRKRLYFVLALLITSCSLFDSPKDGKTSLLDVADEPIGTNCAKGGLKITAGIDSNGNGTLDNTEITSTKFICNGQNATNGLNSLIATVTIPAGNLCENGGIQINSGLDTDRDNVLDDSEVQSSKYICNGANGFYEKQIVIKLIINTNCSGPTTLFDADLVQFNLAEYKVDSAVYIAYDLRTRLDCCSGPTFDGADYTGNLTLKLVDKTNNQIISNSEIVSDDIPKGTFKASKNLRTSFPNQRIDVQISLAGDPGKFAATGRIFFIMYRK